MNKYGTEKSPFSQIDHLGIIVKDMNKAVEYYSSFGIGPFVPLEEKVTMLERKMYDKPADDIRNIIRLTQVGRVQVELIQPAGGRSLPTEFLESRGEGISHLGFYVNDIDKEMAKLIEKGFKVINSGKFLEGGGFAYFDTDEVGGTLFELIQYPSQSPSK